MHLVEGAGGELGELHREGRGGRVGEVVEGRVEVEGFELFGDRVDDLAAPVAYVDAPEAPDPVDQLVAFAVLHVGALAGDDHGTGAVLLQRVEIGPGLDQVGIGGEDAIGGGIEIERHGSDLSVIGKLG